MNFAKAVAILVIVAVMVGVWSLWFQTYLVGAFYAHSGSFLAIIVGVAPLFLTVAAFWAIVKTITFKLDNVVGE